MSTVGDVHWIPRWDQLVSGVRIVTDDADERFFTSELTNLMGPTVLAFVNAHAMNKAVHQLEFFDALLGADFLLRDGVGLELLYRLVRRPRGLNMNGTDYIPKLLAACRGRRVALWGTQQPFLASAGAHAEVCCGVRVVSLESGFHTIDHYVNLLAEVSVDVVLLGMGMPKQEQVAQALKNASTRPVLIVCGGAVIDFMGGRVSRAPLWMRRSGLEWLYRLTQEPRRLLKRYLLGVPMFLWRLQMWARKRGIA
jgi:N-acetylglucosaminyldiphosphoundecaprenol N-acetyl-beta-D-mannosaminyltransferase